jgi:16S rRNA (cytosine1407-C5)-methyltransferase
MRNHESGGSEGTEALAPLFQRLQAIYGQTVASGIEQTFREPKRVGWVRNPLLPAPDLPPGEPVGELTDCYSVAATEREALMSHPSVHTGAVYPMNPSSVTAARLLATGPAQEVLDLAAAPGGKTLQLALAMNNRGRIAAVEPVKGRFHRMRANLARLGVTNVDFYLADGRTIGRKVPERFDRVLLDSPCSSESRIRLDDPKSYRHWSPRKTREMVRKQRGLIRSAYLALKPGGEMLYCTCAFSAEENELVVEYLLRRQPEAELLPAPVGIPGLTEWQGRALDRRLAECRRILPDDLFDGFFLARIRKPAS